MTSAKSAAKEAVRIAENQLTDAQVELDTARANHDRAMDNLREAQEALEKL